jgi:hypothetical protein
MLAGSHRVKSYVGRQSPRKFGHILAGSHRVKFSHMLAGSHRVKSYVGRQSPRKFSHILAGSHRVKFSHILAGSHRVKFSHMLAGSHRVSSVTCWQYLLRPHVPQSKYMCVKLEQSCNFPDFTNQNPVAIAKRMLGC